MATPGLWHASSPLSSLCMGAMDFWNHPVGWIQKQKMNNLKSLFLLVSK